LKIDPGIFKLQKENRELSLKASLFTVFLTVLFGANAVAVKVSFAGLGVFSAAGLRFGFAAVAISFWAVYTGLSLRITLKQARNLLAIALLFTIQIALFYSGLSKTTASHTTLIANLLPFIVLILAHYFIPGESVTFKKTTGILLGFCGVLLLVVDKEGVGSDIRTGDFIVLMAVFLWGVNAVYIKKVIASIHPVLVTLYPMFLAAPCLLLAGYLFDEEMVKHIDLPIGLALFYQSFVTASFGYIAWNTLIRQYGTSMVHSFVFIMPISGVFFGVLLLGEPMTPLLAGSIMFIVMGIVVVNHKRR
jgi:drug/metabolite transporter (DMT)-like permease